MELRSSNFISYQKESSLINLLSAVSLRKPRKEDLPRIKKFYFYETLCLQEIVLNGGTYKYQKNKVGHCLVLEATSKKNQNVKKIYASISYLFENEDCHIYSLKVHEKHRNQKYGSMLLLASIIHAKSCHAEKIKLDTSDLGIPLYMSFGFTHDESLLDSYAKVSCIGQSQLGPIRAGDSLMLDLSKVNINNLNADLKSALMAPSKDQ